MASRRQLAPLTPCAYGDRNLRWHKLGDLQHFVFYVFDVDQEKGLVISFLNSNPSSELFFIVT